MISITAINKIKSNLQRTLYAINKVLQQQQQQQQKQFYRQHRVSHAHFAIFLKEQIFVKN